MSVEVEAEKRNGDDILGEMRPFESSPPEVEAALRAIEGGVPPWMGVQQIMERYSVSKTTAYQYIAAIRAFCGGGKLGRGKVLLAECLYWETNISHEKVRL